MEIINNSRINIIDKKVYRPTNYWTIHVHEFLNYLHEQGFDKVPLPLELNDKQEILSYIKDNKQLIDEILSK